MSKGTRVWVTSGGGSRRKIFFRKCDAEYQADVERLNYYRDLTIRRATLVLDPPKKPKRKGAA